MNNQNSILMSSIPQVVIASAIEQGIREHTENRFAAKRAKQSRRDQNKEVKRNWISALLQFVRPTASA